MSEELTKPVSIASLIKRPGIQGKRAEAQRAVTTLDPNVRQNRFAIGFDDSGSMAGDAIKDAKNAVTGFLASCSPMDTSVAVYPFNAKEQSLSCIYDVINMYLGGIGATGSTPLYSTMIKIMEELIPTRGILFSDGEPTDSNTPAAPGNFEASDSGQVEQKPIKSKYEYALEMAIMKHIPFDTVYIGIGDSRVLKEIADKTGGIYLRFTDSSIFSKQMKYLSPKYYGLLSNETLKAKIEKGEAI